jgi:hypothetical protein
MAAATRESSQDQVILSQALLSSSQRHDIILEPLRLLDMRRILNLDHVCRLGKTLCPFAFLLCLKLSVEV